LSVNNHQIVGINPQPNASELVSGKQPSKIIKAECGLKSVGEGPVHLGGRAGLLTTFSSGFGAGKLSVVKLEEDK